MKTSLYMKMDHKDWMEISTLNLKIKPHNEQILAKKRAPGVFPENLRQIEWEIDFLKSIKV